MGSRKGWHRVFSFLCVIVIYLYIDISTKLPWYLMRYGAFYFETINIFMLLYQVPEEVRIVETIRPSR